MINLSHKKGLTIVLFLLVIGGAFGLGLYVGQVHTRPLGEMASLENLAACTGPSCGPTSLFSSLLNVNKGQPANVDFSNFWKAWQIINENYVNGNATSTAAQSKNTSDQERVWGAISGMVASLGDPYTVFFPPEEKKRFEEDIRGNFSGIGIEIGYKDNVPTVISPLPNSPAKKAGILAGDIILKVNDKETADLSLDETISLIRGKAGTPVTLTIYRETEKLPLEVKLVRGVITIPTLEAKILNSRDPKNKVFVITLYNFSAPASSLFEKAIKEFKASGTNKLVLDLRGNPGGYLESSVDIASWFLPEGKVVVRENHGAGKPVKEYRSSGKNIFSPAFDLKMVILVDKGSASAAEILAGALSEYKVATLVGEKTFGKGSVQELIPLDANSSIKVTIAKWLTPNGKTISQNGLTPDVVVQNATSTPAGGPKDLQLEKALQLLRSN